MACSGTLQASVSPSVSRGQGAVKRRSGTLRQRRALVGPLSQPAGCEAVRVLPIGSFGQTSLVQLSCSSTVRCAVGSDPRPSATQAFPPDQLPSSPRDQSPSRPLRAIPDVQEEATRVEAGPRIVVDTARCLSDGAGFPPLAIDAVIPDSDTDPEVQLAAALSAHGSFAAAEVDSALLQAPVEPLHAAMAAISTDAGLPAVEILLSPTRAGLAGLEEGQRPLDESTRATIPSSATPAISLDRRKPVIVSQAAEGVAVGAQRVRANPFETAVEAARAWWENVGRDHAQRILGFAGPALGIWLCNPLMSLIDTAVVGNGSSVELAALGPGAIVVDNISFLYMFLSVATANLIATALAEKRTSEATGHLRRLLFVALSCGVGMLAFSEFCAGPLVAAFAGSNSAIVPSAIQYAQIRGLAWPAILVTSVAQSASLALQDSWSPLRCLSVASLINLLGDIVLCRFLNFGIAGAAWATAASQYVGCFLMLTSLVSDPRLSLGVALPNPAQLLHFVSLAGPIFLSLCSKVGFYTLTTYMATSLGTVPLAAHQVTIGIFSLCAVCAEPLSQTAQAFLPQFCVGVDRSPRKARGLVETLGVVAVVLGVVEALAAVAVAVLLPSVFTSDVAVTSVMRLLVVPLSLSLLLNPVVLAAEGVLLAGRDVRFLAWAMAGNVVTCGGLLLLGRSLHWGLQANWWIVVLFQLARIGQAGRRIWSPRGMLWKLLEP